MDYRWKKLRREYSKLFHSYLRVNHQVDYTHFLTLDFRYKLGEKRTKYISNGVLREMRGILLEDELNGVDFTKYAESKEKAINIILGEEKPKKQLTEAQLIKAYRKHVREYRAKGYSMHKINEIAREKRVHMLYSYAEPIQQGIEEGWRVKNKGGGRLLFEHHHKMFKTFIKELQRHIHDVKGIWVLEHSKAWHPHYHLLLRVDNYDNEEYPKFEYKDVRIGDTRLNKWMSSAEWALDNLLYGVPSDINGNALMGGLHVDGKGHSHELYLYDKEKKVTTEISNRGRKYEKIKLPHRHKFTVVTRGGKEYKLLKANPAGRTNVTDKRNPYKKVGWIHGEYHVTRYNPLRGAAHYITKYLNNHHTKWGFIDDIYKENTYNTISTKTKYWEDIDMGLMGKVAQQTGASTTKRDLTVKLKNELNLQEKLLAKIAEYKKGVESCVSYEEKVKWYSDKEMKEKFGRPPYKKPGLGKVEIDFRLGNSEVFFGIDEVENFQPIEFSSELTTEEIVGVLDAFSKAIADATLKDLGERGGDMEVLQLTGENKVVIRAIDSKAIGMLAGGKVGSIDKEYETTEGGHPAVKAMRTTRDDKGNLNFSKFIVYK